MQFHISIDGILSSPVKIKIADFLLFHEAPMSEREIASVLKISHMSVNRAMAAMEKINFVNCKTIGKAHLWTVNRKSYAYQAVKKYLSAINSYPTPLDSLKRLLLKYLPKSKVVHLILFGSVAKGEECINSDIDVLIVVKTKRAKDVLEPTLEKLSSRCLDMFGNRLSPYILSEREWKTKRSLEIVKAAQEGTRLYESKI